MLPVEDLLLPESAPTDAPWARQPWSGEPWSGEPCALPLVGAVPPRARRGRHVLRPVVWLMAVAYLVVERAGQLLGAGLDAYVRATDAAGRAVRDACVAVLRWLGPLGRLLRRLTAPVVRLLARCWDRLSVWLLVRMFRPLGRWAREVWDRCRPALERLLARLEPLLRALTALVDAVEAAAQHLGGRWTRVWAPVVRLARELRRPRR